jgi:hypothetical protein
MDKHRDTKLAGNNRRRTIIDRYRTVNLSLRLKAK